MMRQPMWQYNCNTKPNLLGFSGRPGQDLSWDLAAALYEEVLVAAKYQW